MVLQALIISESEIAITIPNWVDLKASLGLALPAHRCLGKLRLIFGRFYFVGHAYFLVVPTMNHNSGS